MLEYDRIDLSEGIDINKCKYIFKKMWFMQVLLFFR